MRNRFPMVKEIFKRREDIEKIKPPSNLYSCRDVFQEAIDAGKRRLKPHVDDSSDARLFELENGICGPLEPDTGLRLNAALYTLGTFTAADLARLASRAERTARDMIIRLRRQGIIRRATIEMRRGMGMQTRAMQTYTQVDDIKKYEEDYQKRLEEEQP